MNFCEILAFSIALRTIEKILTDFDELTQKIGTQNFHVQIGVDNSRMLTENALTTYTTATKNILEWCDSDSPLFDQLINGSDDSKVQPQKSRLTTTLQDGMQIMLTTRMTINYNNLNFRKIIRDIDIVLIRITAQVDGKANTFKEKHPELYEALKDKINDLNVDVSNFKNQLRFEVVSIDNLKMRIKNIQTVLALDEDFDLHDEIVNSVRRLRTECNSYRKRHE